MAITRRSFFGGTLAAFGGIVAADAFGAGAGARLRFGVMSDVHVGGKPDAVATLKKALRWFDANKADAVVFSGDMAMVGPRPIVEDEVRYYGNRYAIFSRVKPGITGLWQASGRSDTDYGRRVALDCHYVLNWSPWMDLWVILRTVIVVLTMKGAR